ncbi:replication initiator [Thermopolyspora sp. NPDC052614]|uniref:replication initiator n=1 Tax=Thermopolyspora sp. NPDC052614 TaxID=3155682 RepID=UPI00342F10ED
MSTGAKDGAGDGEAHRHGWMIDPVIAGELADVARVMADPGYVRWRSMVAATGGCAHPVHLSGRSMIVDTTTGEVLHEYRTADEPSGRLLVACGNRRSAVCPACSRVYQGDTFQLIRAGLSGGKGVPESVSGRPRVFVTLTAPSFGPVHTRTESPDPSGERVIVRACRPRRSGGVCEHGRPVGCPVRHEAGDARLGQPICPECYDYVGAVLWQAHAGALWHRFTLGVRRELARLAGMSRHAFGKRVRVSFAKVAEYQRRGLVHFHAIIRLDGPKGAGQDPPSWAHHGLLAAAIPAAVRAVEMTSAVSALGRWRLAWGDQLDIRPIILPDGLEGLSERAVASYIAKYASKGAEASGTVQHRISCAACKGRGVHAESLAACSRCRGTGLKPGLHLEELPVTEHARRMIRTCWELGGRVEFAHLRLRPWAHMLGFRGHFSTKSRRYSVTLGELRKARAEYRADQARQRHGLPAVDDVTTLVVGHWRFAGTGYTAGEAILAGHIRERIAQARVIAWKQADHDGHGKDTGGDEGAGR